MLKAMFLLAFHAFLRIGEITTIGAGGSVVNVIHQENIHIVSTRLGAVISLTMHHFKHSTGRPVTLRISSRTGEACPVEAVGKYMEMRGSNPGPFFVFVGG
jgi:hypothetical protein